MTAVSQWSRLARNWGQREPEFIGMDNWIEKIKVDDRRDIVDRLRRDPSVGDVISEALERIPEFIPDGRLSLAWQPDPELVCVAPVTAAWARWAVVSLVAKYGLGADVHQSDLDKDPLF